MLREPTISSSANMSQLLPQMGQLLPQTKEFLSPTGNSRYYYLIDNPWKLSSDNNVQKIFRCCIRCGTNRFTDKAWNELNKINSSPVVCESDFCFQSMHDMDKFIPRHVYRITSADRARIQYARVMEFFEFESAHKFYLKKTPPRLVEHKNEPQVPQGEEMPVGPEIEAAVRAPAAVSHHAVTPVRQNNSIPRSNIIPIPTPYERACELAPQIIGATATCTVSSFVALSGLLMAGRVSDLLVPEIEDRNSIILISSIYAVATPLITVAAFDAGTVARNRAEDYSQRALESSRPARILVGSVGTILSCVANCFSRCMARRHR